MRSYVMVLEKGVKMKRAYPFFSSFWVAAGLTVILVGLIAGAAGSALPARSGVITAGSARRNPPNVDPGPVQSTKTTPHPAVLNGTVAHASSKGLALIYSYNRQPAVLDANGSFTFSLELRFPIYAELEFEFLRAKRLKVYLLPGQSLSLTCDASDLYGTARFTGGGATENNGLALLQVQYDRIDYRQWFGSNRADFLTSLRSQRMKLERVLADYAQTHAELDPGFLRMERARISYWEAFVRIARTEQFGDGGWVDYVSKLDFNVNDPTLLGIDTYGLFLRRYIKAKAKERMASDSALKASINQQTEAQYAAAVETIANPIVRNVVLHEILRIHFADPDQNEGPLGCKGMEGLMARFDRDCTDKVLRENIDRLYRQCQDGRNAPVIRVYKTAGTTTLDAHIFPASGAKPGEKRPAFLFFHGGGWSIGMPEWGYRQCKRYAERGLVGISFEYRTRWRHGTTPAECTADAKSAVRWVRAHADELGVDPDRIVAAGFSAGGHLAAVTGIVPGCDDPSDDKTVSAVPNAMVLMSASFDVAHDSYFREILAGRGEPADFSPAQHVRSGLPPAIVFHGLEDNLCPFPETEAFCKAMKASGNRCELNTFPGGHFRSTADWAVIDEKIDEFLASLGFLDTSLKPETASSIQ